MRKRIFIIIIQIIAAGCVFDSEFKEKVKEPYYLGVDYSTNQVCLHWRENLWSGGIEKIPGRILEIGWNNRFIIAKQQPLNDSSIKYFIIDMHKDSINCDTCVLGPLNKEQFFETKKKLGIPEMLVFKWRVENFDVIEINN
jgi:hypothetical protein